MAGVGEYDWLLMATECPGDQSQAPLAPRPAPQHSRWTPHLPLPRSRCCRDHSPGRACSRGLEQAAGCAGM